MALRLQLRMWQRRVALLVLTAAAIIAMLLMDSALPGASRLRTPVDSATIHAVDPTGNKEPRAADGWVADSAGATGAPEARAASGAVRQVACWRMRGGQVGDNVGDVRCAAATADSTVLTPPEVLAARVSRSDSGGGGEAMLEAYEPPDADYTYVACYSSRSIGRAAFRVAAAVLPAAQVTVASCARACYDAGHAYAVLVGENGCLCETQRSAARMQPDRNCQLPCAGDRSILCGGFGGAAAIYHLRSADGSVEWTAWMTPWSDGESSNGLAAVRIRRCLALRSGGYDGHANEGGQRERRCSAELERRPGADSQQQQPLLRHFVGCYAVADDPPSAVAVLPNETHVTEGCLRACEERGFAYAFGRLAGGCSCSQTMGVSRPVTFCDGVYGLPFYAVRSPSEKEDDDEEHKMDDKEDDNALNDVRDSSLDNLVRVATAIEVRESGTGRVGGNLSSSHHAENTKVKNARYESKNAEFADVNENTSDKIPKINDQTDKYDIENDVESDRERYGGVGEVRVRNDSRPASIELVFDRPPPDKRRVLLLAYHRSGSTFASELVSKHPGALYIFEPDVIYGHHRFALGEYGDVEQLHREFYRAFDRFLRCDVHRLPILWMALSSFFPRPFEHSPRMVAYIRCLRAHGPVACTPYFQAQCEAASIVSAKTIRLTATPQTAAFVRANPSLVVLHLMRDPRAIASSRKIVGAFSTRGVRDLCNDMQRTAQLVGDSERLLASPSGFVTGAAVNTIGSGSRRLFNVYYEDLVLKPLQSAQHVYAAMFRLNISEATVRRLRVITGEAKDEGPHVPLNRRYTTRKDNPERSLHKWRRKLSAAELATIGKLCADVLRWYPLTEASQNQSALELDADYSLINS